MSGTSLDGLDIAYCEFYQENGKWKFSIPFAETYSYSTYWEEKLRNAPLQSGEKLQAISVEFGQFSASCVNRFIQEHNCKPTMIASHGHTIYHRPDLGYTLQIGSGADIATATALPTICDFRSSDVALGGQGAPLVPIGDRLLFGDYDYCLNIGGFANISYEKNGQRIAYDVAPANILLNSLALRAGMRFDEDGRLASNGKIIPQLLERLNNLPFYRQPAPKSLGREWLEQHCLPIIDDFIDSPINDILHSVTEHIALQIAVIGKDTVGSRILISGGGALNRYLIQRIAHHSSLTLDIPEERIINYKEALIFAFLGVLRLCGEVNCLASVTGASKDHSSGCIYQGK